MRVRRRTRHLAIHLCFKQRQNLCPPPFPHSRIFHLRPIFKNQWIGQCVIGHLVFIVIRDKFSHRVSLLIFFYRLAIPLVKTFPCIILCAACPPYILNLANTCPHFGHFISPWVWSSAIRSTMHFTNPPRPPLRYLYSSVLHFAQKIEMVRISLRAIRLR